MNLQSLKISGFKSFLNTMSMDFSSHLTGIVGPNGCGKSNVLEAVRWVLGESAARQLRANLGVDVIFNGSAGHKPLGQCSVELVFENAEGRLGGAYAGYAELSVRRRLTTDGTSTYYLNGKPCRRKDVQEVFLGTGLGARGYALIEQDLTNRLITATPDELRHQIEEAAGVSRFRERRRETQQSMQRTQSNLQEVENLLEEMQRTVERLKRQARTVRRARALQEEQSQLRLELNAVRWGEWQKVLSSHDERLRKAKHQENEAKAELLAVESVREQNANDLREARGQHSELLQERAMVESRQQLAEERLLRLKQEQKDLEASVEQLLKALQDCKNEQQILQKRGEDASGELEQLGAEADRVIEQLGQLQGQSEHSLRDLNERYDQLREQQNQLQSRLSTAELNLEHNLALDARLQQQQKELGAQGSERIGELQQGLQTLNQSLQECEDQSKKDTEWVRKRRAQLEQTQTELNKSELLLTQKQTRLDSLIEMGEPGEDQVQTLLQWCRDQGIGAPVNIEVSPGWEYAVDSALGVLASARLAPSKDALLASGDAPSDVSLVLEEWQQGAGEPVDSMATVLLRAPAPLYRLLAKVGRATASDEVPALLQRYERVVLSDGQCHGRGWSYSGAAGGVLRRGAEVKELGEQLGPLNKKVTEAKAEVDNLRNQVNEAEQTSHASDERLQQQQQQKSSAQSELEILENNLQRVNKDSERLARELQEVSQQREQLQGEIQRIQDELQTLTPNLGVLQKQRDDRHTQERGLYTRQRDIAVALENAQNRINESAERLLEQRTEEARINAEAKDKRSQMSELEQPLQDNEKQLQELVQATGSVQQTEAEMQAKVEKCEQALAATEQKIHGLDQKRQEQVLLQERIKTEQAEAKTRVGDLLETLQKDNCDPVQLLTQIDEEILLETREEQLKTLADKIAHLGALNYVAMEELEHESERLEKITSQREDILKALDELRNAGREIDARARDLFNDSFAAINQQFQSKFIRLFGGGEASLEMEDADAEQPGVIIRACPPGKSSKSLSLMSGGEKSLTSIALVLAMFECNPAPICIMDEVDAALDDANALRFADLIQEMSQQVQFVVITHNKVVMESVQVLQGITMQEPGVSSVISVDMDSMDSEQVDA